MPYKNCLLSGITSSGKTYTSRRLVELHGFSRIPGDALVLAFQQVFPALGIGHEIAGMSDEDAHQSSCHHFGQFVAKFMNALAWESSMPYVLDTFHVRPIDLNGLDRTKTAVIFLGFPDADPKRLTQSARAYQTSYYGAPVGWVAEEDSRVEEMFSMFIRMSRELEQECRRLSYTFVNTGASFNAAVDQVLALATAKR